MRQTADLSSLDNINRNFAKQNMKKKYLKKKEFKQN